MFYKGYFMKKLLISAISLLFTSTISAQEFSAKVNQISSDSFVSTFKSFPNELILNGLDCKGGNISPEISWKGAPKETKSFAISLFDASAPTDSGFWHWVVFNIPSNVNTIKKGASKNIQLLPKGAIESRTDFIKDINGVYGYGGPCPSVGDKPHNYVFKVTALKDYIPLDKDATPAFISYYVGQLKLAESKIIVPFSR
jgi:Raf kinase inhibitor-like YbhB/YbcL family protein